MYKYLHTHTHIYSNLYTCSTCSTHTHTHIHIQFIYHVGKDMKNARTFFQRILRISWCTIASSFQHSSSIVPATGIGAMFQCGSRWATNICKVASFNGTQYGQWAHYQSCACPVSHLFLAKHLPNTSEFKWIKSKKRGPHCFPEQQGQMLPSLTEGIIQENCEAWCVRPFLSSHACPLLPGCECLAQLGSQAELRPAATPLALLLLAPMAFGLGAIGAKLWRRELWRRRVTVRELGEEMLKA